MGLLATIAILGVYHTHRFARRVCQRLRPKRPWWARA